jgi:hypothetical protein
MIQKPSSLGIASVESCQLALIVGTTGSGSMDSPAPSPVIINSSALLVAIDFASPIYIDMPPPTFVDMPSMVIIGSPTFAVTRFFPCATGSTLAITGGFKLAIDMQNFHVNDAGISRLLPAVESTAHAIDSAAPSLVVPQRVIEDNSTPASPLPSPGTGQALESSTRSVGSITFLDSRHEVLFWWRPSFESGKDSGLSYNLYRRCRVLANEQLTPDSRHEVLCGNDPNLPCFRKRHHLKI